MRQIRDGWKPGHLAGAALAGAALAGAALAGAALAAAVAVTPAAAQELLTLRANDAEGEPGGRIALVLRTYAPRGIEQGQICVRAQSRTKAAAAGPLVVLEDAVVFSDAGDAVSLWAFDEMGQTAMVDFSSATGSVNLSDGPLAVFFLRLDDALAGGEEFDLLVDLAATSLVAADGQPLTIEPRAGVLTIRAPGASLSLSAEGDSVLPGGVAELGVDTREPFAVGAGQVALTYDPAIASGPPQVVMNPRYGAATFFADTSVPGRVVVTFQSPDGSLNSVPGSLVTILLPTSVAGASALDLEPGSTWLVDPGGQPIDLVLEPGVLEVNGPFFADGFESGALSAWSAMVP